jgi:magnesium transporter
VIAHICMRDARAPHSALRILSGPDIRDAPVPFGSHDIVWVDIVDPGAEDVAWLEKTFAFHQLALEDVTRRHQRPKLEEYPDYYFGVLYATRVQPGPHRIAGSELQFFWGATYLVTLHAEAFPEIDELASRTRAAAMTPIMKATGRPLGIPDLAYRLIDAIVDGYFPAVDAVAEWAEDIEVDMFSGGRSEALLQTIFSIRKDLIELRKVVAPSREVINVLLRRDRDLFGDEFVPYFQDIYDHTVRVIESLDTYRDLLGSAVDTYLSIASNDVNQTVKKMTAVTAVLMVDALIAGIYGMNFENMPELKWQFGYLWALGLMLAAALLLWGVFKHIRWL